MSLPQRIVVVGSSGAGKSTFAGRLAAARGVPHVELDAHWHLPGWTTDLAATRASVDAATAQPAWTLCGNYVALRDLVWPRADAVVWLDYPLHRIARQITARTLRRGLQGEVLWNGNRESLLAAFTSRESVIWWALSTHASRRADLAQAVADPANAHLQVFRVHTAREAEALLGSLS
jgi:adenylate kinase family enzyme